MANEYATRAELKEWQGVEPADLTRDNLLDWALEAASRGIDNVCGRRFFLDADPVVRTYRTAGRVVSEDDGELLLVDDIGDAAELVVQTGRAGGPWTEVTGYETTPENAVQDGQPIAGLLRPGGTWAVDPRTRVRVTARFGWPAVPADVKEAALIQAGRLAKRRTSPEGVTGSAEWGVVRLSRRDPDVWALIEPFILPGFG